MGETASGVAKPDPQVENAVLHRIVTSVFQGSRRRLSKAHSDRAFSDVHTPWCTASVRCSASSPHRPSRGLHCLPTQAHSSADRAFRGTGVRVRETLQSRRTEQSALLSRRCLRFPVLLVLAMGLWGFQEASAGSPLLAVARPDIVAIAQGFDTACSGGLGVVSVLSACFEAARLT